MSLYSDYGSYVYLFACEFILFVCYKVVVRHFYTTLLVFFFQAEDGIRDLVRSRGLGDVYKRQDLDTSIALDPTIAKAHLHRAIILLRHGRNDEACAAMLQAREMGDPTVDQLLFLHCQ
mgnify:CR=1 FL=1